jgi:pyrroline-5-carboxylate reductase
MTATALGKRHIGFIGAGNMAEALVRGLLGSKAASTAGVRASDPSPLRRQGLLETYGVSTTDDNATLAQWADVLVLAVKPQVADQALASIAGSVGDALVISIAAGITTQRIEAALPKGTHVVRAMPNTAAMALAAATAVAPGRHAEPADLQLARSLFESVGRCVVVPEASLDAVTGLSGSGPAYVMLFIEALADGGVKAGLPRDVALMLAAQTVYGAAKLQLESGEHPAVLKDRVTSPGGTTIAGLGRLEAAGIRGALIDAVVAASERSRELGSGQR